MAELNITAKCKQIRHRLIRSVSQRLSTNNPWIMNHIASCPRCQQRMGQLGKVDFVFSLLKSQPHKLDLLMRANERAIGVLKHSLRNTSKAQKLKHTRPEPIWPQRYSRYILPIANVAACLVVIILMKTGIFSSMNKFKKQGNTAMKHYYAKHLDEETVNDIFTT